MLWLRIAVIVASVAGVVTYSTLKTGMVQRLSQENGVYQQAIVQKDQAIEQREQLRAEAEAEKARLAEEYQKAMKALSERERAEQESLQQVNTLMAEIKDLREENEELKVWADRHHPDAVAGVLNAARTGESPRAYSSDETDLPPPTPNTGAEMPDRGVPGGD